MFQLIPITLFALAGLVAAAPTAVHNEPLSVMNTEPIMKSNPIVWKRHHPQSAVDFGTSNEFIKSTIAKTLAEHEELIKRQDLPVLPIPNLEDVFRGIFDRIIDHIIEVTPLNDIVHGNYDLLYDLFSSKIQEIFANLGNGIDQSPPFDLFGILGQDTITEKGGDDYDEYEGQEDDKEEEEEDNDEEDDDEDSVDSYNWKDNDDEE